MFVQIMKTKRMEKESSFLFKRTEKNAMNGTFFLKEWKRTQRMERSFLKNGKECKERNVLFIRREKNAKNETFF